MIDEKELISHIENQYRQWGEEYTAEQILGDIEDFPKANEWIPVEERLPEDNQAVLTCKNKQISILIWRAERRIWLEPKGNWWWSYCMVEKWQPSPEPWKGETE